MSTKETRSLVANVSSLKLSDDVAVTDQEPEELERSFVRRRQEKKSLYQRVGKDRSNYYLGSKLPLMPPKTPSIEGPVPSIAASITAEGNHEQSIARSMERRQKELDGQNRRSPPSKRAKKYIYDKDQDLIQFTPKPMPSKYSNKLLLSNSEKNTVPGTRAHQILALRRSEIAGHDAFNSGMRVSESLSELRHRLEEVDGMRSLPHLSGPKSKHANRLSGLSVSKSVPRLGNHGESRKRARKERKAFKVKHKVQARNALTTRISPAPKTTEQIYKEYKQGKHRKVPVITPGLPYRGLRSKKKFPSGYAMQKDVLERQRLYRIQQNEDETIQDYQNLAETLGLLSMSVTGHVQKDDDALSRKMENNDEFYHKPGHHRRGNNVPNGSSILSQRDSGFVAGEKNELLYTNSAIPPTLPGDGQNLKQNQHFKMNKNFVKADPISGSISRESSKGGGWWKNYDDDLIFNDGMDNGSFFDSRVSQSMSSSGMNGPFHFLFFNDKGKEERSRTPYERASFCPASPHGRRVYWEESIGRTASMQMNGRAFSANHRPYSSSYVLPPNSSKWGRQNDGKVYGPDIVETVVVSAPSHDRLLVAPLADPRSRESMRDPSFQMSENKLKGLDSHVMEGVTADGQRHSSITPASNGHNDIMMEDRNVRKHDSYSKINENENRESSVEAKNTIKAIASDLSLEQFKPPKAFDHSGIGAWDARSECSSRPTSSENMRLNTITSKTQNQNRSSQKKLARIQETTDQNVLQEFKLRNARGTKSKFCKLKLGVDASVCLAQISGKRVTASQKDIYVPNGTFLSNILDFLIEIFALNKNLVWAIEHFEAEKSVWAPIHSNDEWQSLLSMFSSNLHESNIPVKLRVRRHAESSGLVKDNVGTLINTPSSLKNYKDGNVMQRRSIREDVPTAMLTAKKFTVVSKDGNNAKAGGELVSFAAIDNTISDNAVKMAGTFDIDALQANGINGDHSILEVGQPSSPVWNETKFDGWSSNPEHDATAYAPSYDGHSKLSSKSARAKIRVPQKLSSSIDSGGSSISKELYQRMQGSQISPQAKKLAHYLRSKRFIQSYELQRDRAGRKPFYLPTNDPILDESYTLSGLKAGMSILEMEHVAGSPFWNRRSSVNRKSTKKRFPIRKLPSIDKMKQFQASILKKYSIKEKDSPGSKRKEESNKIVKSVSINPESGESSGSQSVRDSIKCELRNRFSFSTLYSKERLNRARLSMKIPKVDERSDRSLRSAQNRLFITEDDYSV